METWAIRWGLPKLLSLSLPIFERIGLVYKPGFRVKIYEKHAVWLLNYEDNCRPFNTSTRSIGTVEQSILSTAIGFPRKIDNGSESPIFLLLPKARSRAFSHVALAARVLYRVNPLSIFVKSICGAGIQFSCRPLTHSLKFAIAQISFNSDVSPDISPYIRRAFIG